MHELYCVTYYNSFEGTAESMLVGDPNEAWIFHVLPDDTGTSAIWAAQRVPDDHVAVVANMFVIREIDLTDTDNFMGSDNIYTIAEAKGWYDPSSGDLLDFTGVYSDGEYANKYYTGRRMWRAFSLMTGLDLPSTYTSLMDAPYNFSYKPNEKVSLEDFMGVMQDYYEGTDYDLTVGPAAGPFGTPDRYSLTDSTGVEGAWERSIALFRTGYSFVSSLNKDMENGIVWYGSHAAHGTVYVPVPSGASRAPSVLSQSCSPAAFDRDCLYWAHKTVENFANLRWSVMIEDIKNTRNLLHQRALNIENTDYDGYVILYVLSVYSLLNPNELPLCEAKTLLKSLLELCFSLSPLSPFSSLSLFPRFISLFLFPFSLSLCINSTNLSPLFSLYLFFSSFLSM